MGSSCAQFLHISLSGFLYWGTMLLLQPITERSWQQATQAPGIQNIPTAVCIWLPWLHTAVTACVNEHQWLSWCLLPLHKAGKRGAGLSSLISHLHACMQRPLPSFLPYTTSLFIHDNSSKYHAEIHIMSMTMFWFEKPRGYAV